MISIERRKNIKETIDNIINDDKVSEAIEDAIYNYIIEFNSVYAISEYLYEETYITKCNSIIFNLNKENNEYLLDSIQDGDIDIKKIPYLLPHELNPDNWKKILEKKAYIEDKKKNMNTINTYTCRKCSGKKHSFNQLQTRSCDEPMTTFITCLTCGFTFKK